MKRKLLLCLSMCVAGLAFAQAQSTSVTGQVNDGDGAPLPGASIIEKGTTNGVQSDFDGNFSISVSNNNATLVVSYLGFTTQEIPLKGKTVVAVVLEESAASLDEVVVVGYGTQKKQAVTGSVATADLETYKNVPVNNILETVKGTMPGLNVGAINTAGAVANLNIRGQNSTSASNVPLIVLDGVIYSGSVADIAPDDVESFTVLKDASAAAVYGSRSSNGVILIETKKGKGINGQPKFELKTSYGVTKELERLEIYDAQGYIQRLLDIRVANDLEANPDNIALYLQAEEQKNYNATPDHRPTVEDPYDLFRQYAYVSKAHISVSNSTEKTNYYISAAWTDQQGVVMNDDYKNFSGRINIDSDLTNWFNLGVKSMYSIRDFSGSSPSIYRATHFSPYASIFDEDGKYVQFPQTTTSFNSPFWDIATSDLDLQNNLTALVSGKFTIPGIEGLSYTLNFSNTLRWNERNQFFDEFTLPGEAANGTGSRSYSRRNEQLLDNILKYNRTFNNRHNIDITLLYSTEKARWESQSASAQGFDNTVLGDYKLEDGQTQSVNTGGGEEAAIGQMARATYTFDDKYSLTGTFRRDGFSGFSKNEKWGNFSSFGANWDISKEAFLKNSNTVNNLALRVSYGSTGNQSISAYSTLAKVGTSKYIFAGDPSYTVTQAISSLAIDDLSWEKTTGWNLGLDFSLLNNRISGSVDAYNTNTTNLLFSLALPRASGASSILSNIGEIENKGLEVQLHTLNLDKGDFKWSSDFAFSLNRNKVVSILGDDKDGDGKEDDLISSGFYIGRTLGTIYATKVVGMYQQEDENNGTILDGMRPGDYILEDVDGDGKITSDQDRQFIGDDNPNFRWSWTNTFSYKNFSVMAYIYSIWGGNSHFLSGSNTPYNDGYANRGDLNHPVYDYWTPQNTNAMFPRTDYKDNASYTGTKYYDRSFIKLQKLALTYDFSEIVRPMGIYGLTMSLSADNMFTYAPHWVGLDPETDQGLVDTARPSLRTYLFTLSLNL